MPYLSRSKIGRTGKYWGNGKIKTKQNKKIEGRLFLKISALSKKWVDFYQKKDRLAQYPSEATTIFYPLAASEFSHKELFYKKDK